MLFVFENKCFRNYTGFFFSNESILVFIKVIAIRQRQLKKKLSTYFRVCKRITLLVGKQYFDIQGVILRKSQEHVHYLFLLQLRNKTGVILYIKKQVDMWGDRCSTLTLFLKKYIFYFFLIHLLLTVLYFCLFVGCFFRVFCANHSYGDVTFADEGQQVFTYTRHL